MQAGQLCAWGILTKHPALRPRLLQENQLSGTLDDYSRALHNCSLPSSTRFLSLGGNQLAGSVPQASTWHISMYCQSTCCNVWPILSLPHATRMPGHAEPQKCCLYDC